MFSPAHAVFDLPCWRLLSSETSTELHHGMQRTYTPSCLDLRKVPEAQLLLLPLLLLPPAVDAAASAAAVPAAAAAEAAAEPAATATDSVRCVWAITQTAVLGSGAFFRVELCARKKNSGHMDDRFSGPILENSGPF